MAHRNRKKPSGKQKRSVRLLKSAQARTARAGKEAARAAAVRMSPRDKRVAVHREKKIWDQRAAELEKTSPGGRGNEIPLETKKEILRMYFRLWTYEGKAVQDRSQFRDINSVTGRSKVIGGLWNVDWRTVHKLVVYYIATGLVKVRVVRGPERPPDPVLKDIRQVLVNYETGKTHVPVTLDGLITLVSTRHGLQISPQRMSAIADELG